MMGIKDGQLNFICLDVQSLIPQNHLLRRIDSLIDFGFIYKLAEPYYAAKGRPSVDPVCMVKMLLVGYLYGIRSERRLEEEVALISLIAGFVVLAWKIKSLTIRCSVKTAAVGSMIMIYFEISSTI